MLSSIYEYSLGFSPSAVPAPGTGPDLVTRAELVYLGSPLQHLILSSDLTLRFPVRHFTMSHFVAALALLPAAPFTTSVLQAAEGARINNIFQANKVTTEAAIDI